MGSKAYDEWKPMEPMDEAQRLLFNRHTGLVFHMLHKFPRSLIFARRKNEDLVQEGYVALAKATQKWDASKEVQFQTYACNAIFTRMARYLARNSKSYIVPNNTMLRELSNLPPETSIDAWGEQLLGSYCDPVISFWENWDSEEEYMRTHRIQIKWTYAMCLERGRLFQTRTEWLKGCNKSYDAARRNLWSAQIYREIGI